MSLTVFPVINDIKSDLNASQGSIALSLSLYILFQGGVPLIWSPISEIIGRKICFLVATTIFSVCQFIVAAATKNVGMLIAFRVIAAGGSSAMLAIAAGTLADLYEPAERGVKVSCHHVLVKLFVCLPFIPLPGRHLLQLSTSRSSSWCEYG